MPSNLHFFRCFTAIFRFRRFVAIGVRLSHNIIFNDFVLCSLRFRCQSYAISVWRWFELELVFIGFLKWFYWVSSFFSSFYLCSLSVDRLSPKRNKKPNIYILNICLKCDHPNSNACFILIWALRMSIGLRDSHQMNL